MTASRPGVLYSSELLALAVELAEFPYDSSAPLHGEARSRTCGSTVMLSCTAGGEDGLTRLGIRLTACAVGQAAGAIFASEAQGRTVAEIEAAEATIAQWLSGAGAQPTWPRIEALAPALSYPARHDAILLPWRAARDALSKAPDAR